MISEKKPKLKLLKFPVEPPLHKDTPLDCLKEAVKDMENGKIKADRLMVLADYRNDLTEECLWSIESIGVTGDAKLGMLERFKQRLMGDCG